MTMSEYEQSVADDVAYRFLKAIYNLGIITKNHKINRKYPTWINKGINRLAAKESGELQGENNG
jgi:hypothetical protein